MPTVLPDVLQHNLKLVFCGTAAGTKSAQVGAYYAGPGNQFWDVLQRVGLTPHKLEPHHFRALPQYGIGLTDLAQKTSGMDKVLKRADFDVEGFRRKMLDYRPRMIAFNGKKSASMFFGRDTKYISYGLQAEMLGQSAIFVLPSTSGPARGFWDESQWQALAERVRG
jgi:TDG/mug DNA glycosylase family protein